MSGLEAGLAIAGCVFGLIQAYDAAERTISRIKARRQAHRASIPSVYLEKSLEQGKKEIKSLVATGRERFGQTYLSEVDEGDIVIQNALLQITNQTLTALIDRLAEARDDDTVIDFSECIDAADNGRIRASIALHEYFLRKQKEAALSSAAVTSKIDTPTDSVKATVSLAGTQKVCPSEEKPGIVAPTKADSQTEFTSPKRTKTFQSFFKLHSRTGSNRSSLSTASTLLESPPLSGGQPVFTDRPNRNAARADSADAPSKPLPNNSHLSGTSYASSKTGHTSTASTQSPISSTSRRTSLSSEVRPTIFQNDVAPITKYGGCCKSAYLLREGKQGKGLIRKETSPYGTIDKYRTFVWACSTNGCEFEVPAYRNAKRRIVFDDTPRHWDEMKYTLNFLAKSHATRKDPLAAIQYRCVFCNLFGFQSHLFNDQKELLTHILTHAGSSLGTVKLEGGIVVSNSGLAVNEPFDVAFPVVEERESAQRPWPSPRNSLHSTAERAVVFSSERTSPTPWSDENDVEINHWAREGVQ